MTHYSHDALIELAGAYALGATTPEETKAVEDAVASSPALAAELMAYHKVVTDLVMAQRGVMPSPEVRERLAERLREAASPTLAPVISAVPRRRSYAPYAAAASLVFAALLSVQIARMSNEMKVVSSKLEHREATLNSLLHAEKDLRVIHLRAADSVAGPGIQLFWDSRHQLGVVHAFRLPPAPAGSSYQLWAIIDNVPVSVRVFNSDPDGHALVEGVPLPPSYRGVSKILLTVEPRGGSRAPTSVPLLGSTTLGAD